jgi:hypothetical protein
MIYRQYGNSGKSVSVLNMGTVRFEGTPEGKVFFVSENEELHSRQINIFRLPFEAVLYS